MAAPRGGMGGGGGNYPHFCREMVYIFRLKTGKKALGRGRSYFLRKFDLPKSTETRQIVRGLIGHVYYPPTLQ